MTHHPHAHNPNHQTGISDEAAIEAHDMIHHAEEEEEELHPQSTNESQDSQGLGSSQKPMTTMGRDVQSKSNLEQVKDKLGLSGK